MGIRVSKIRISNFRSIESAETELSETNILIGQNNSGKSNFLRAIYIGLTTNPSVSDQDIYVANGENLSEDKVSIIDLMIRPVDEVGSYADEFSDFWTGVFTDKWIATDVINGAFVGIRTTIEYDVKFDQYFASKRPITQWNDSIDDAVCERRQGYTADMQSYIECFYMDAHRDILDDLRNKKSFFGRATSSRDLSEDVVREVEEQLNLINKKLVENAPALSTTQEMISRAGSLFGLQQSQIAIEPISRSISDLHRGMDVKFSDGMGPTLSVSEQGMGTRSWISFLTLGAYVSYLINSIKRDDEDAELFVVLALEEPEAHLHSYAQKKLFEQIKQFAGQKIVSTHSANIVAQANIEDYLHLYKSEGKTVAHRANVGTYTAKELAKIRREFIRNKGDLLFSTAIVLAEGITEELAIPVYFQEYFDIDPNAAGIAIIGIGGQNYKSFLHLLKDFDIPWYIFGDGEQNAKKAVKNAVRENYNKDYLDLPNVIMLDDGDDYEDHLVKAGYADCAISAIDKFERELRVENDPEGAARDPQSFFEKFVKDGLMAGKCYSGEEGKQKALLDCLQKKDGKAKYAFAVADEIVKYAEDGKKIPPKVNELLTQIEKLLTGGDERED